MFLPKGCQVSNALKCFICDSHGSHRLHSQNFSVRGGGGRRSRTGLREPVRGHSWQEGVTMVTAESVID